MLLSGVQVDPSQDFYSVLATLPFFHFLELTTWHVQDMYNASTKPHWPPMHVLHASTYSLLLNTPLPQPIADLIFEPVYLYYLFSFTRPHFLDIEPFWTKLLFVYNPTSHTYGACWCLESKGWIFFGVHTAITNPLHCQVDIMRSPRRAHVVRV